MSWFNKIYLIGFMGSGKSTIGKKLASGLCWSFVDLDKKIEEETSLKISEIFSKHGETFFREVETRILRTIGSLADIVISTGGGAPCFYDNMNFMIETGLTIYLKMTPEQLRSRLATSSEERPLIKNICKNKLLDYIEKKLAEREKWYNQADVIIDGLNTDSAFLLTLVKKSLKS